MPKQSVINGTNLETIFQDLPLWVHQNAQIVTPLSRPTPCNLGHIGVFVSTVLCPLNILLVYQHLDTLLDNRDGGSKSCLKDILVRFHSHDH